MNVEHLEKDERELVRRLYNGVNHYIETEGDCMLSTELAFNKDVLKLIDIIFELNDRIQEEKWNSMGEDL